MDTQTPHTPSEGPQDASPVVIFGVPIHGLSRRQVIEHCREWLRASTGHHIVTANPEILLRARTHPDFRRILQAADLVTPDGIGVRWAAAFLRTIDAKAQTRFDIFVWFIRTMGAFSHQPQTLPSPVPERIAGSDLLWDVAREAAATGARVYLIGGKRQTAGRAAQALRQAIPGLIVEGFLPDHLSAPYPPYELQCALETYAPHVVFIGYGAPHQSEWIRQNLHRFPSIRIAMGVGGALDFLAGNARRAPSGYQAHGMEWFWRFTHQPTRFLRTLRATLVFPTMLLLFCLRHMDQMHTAVPAPTRKQRSSDDPTPRRELSHS